MTESNETPQICYYAAILAEACKQGNGDGFCTLLDKIAKLISSSELEKVESLAHSYSECSQALLQHRIRWLEKCGAVTLKMDIGADEQTEINQSENSSSTYNLQVVELSENSSSTYNIQVVELSSPCETISFFNHPMTKAENAPGSVRRRSEELDTRSWNNTYFSNFAMKAADSGNSSRSHNDTKQCIEMQDLSNTKSGDSFNNEHCASNSKPETNTGEPGNAKSSKKKTKQKKKKSKAKRGKKAHNEKENQEGEKTHAAMPLDENTKLSSVPQQDYGSVMEGFNPIKEIGELLHNTANSKSSDKNSCELTRKSKKERKKKSKKKEIVKSSADTEKTAERPTDMKANEEKRGSEDVPWPLQDHANLSMESSAGTPEMEYKEQGKISYAGKLTSNVTLDSAGWSLASSSEDSLSSSSLTGLREPSTDAGSILPNQGSINNESSLSNCDSLIKTFVPPYPAFTSVKANMTDSSIDTRDQDCVVKKFNLVTPKSKTDLTDELKVLLDNDWGLCFFNDSSNAKSSNTNALSNKQDEPDSASTTDLEFIVSSDAGNHENFSNPNSVFEHLAHFEDERMKLLNSSPFDYDGAIKFLQKEWLSVSYKCNQI